MKGLEPSTFCMASRRSSQLSYIRVRAEYSDGLAWTAKPLRRGLRGGLERRPRCCGAVGSIDDRAERGGEDRPVHADAPERLVVDVRLDIRGSLRIRASGHRVLVVVANRDGDAERLLERVDQGSERAVALALDHALLAVDAET